MPVSIRDRRSSVLCLLALMTSALVAACNGESAQFRRGNTGGAIGVGGAAGAGGAPDDMPGSDGGADHPGLGNGATCAGDTDCSSGACSWDKVCCDKACEGACVTCKATLGTCTPATAGTNPRAMCDDQGKASCGTTGVCDGEGACQKYPANTVCSST